MKRSLQEGHRSGRRGEGRIKGHGGKSKAGAATSQAAVRVRVRVRVSGG
jgi:hypothetical protein